MKQHIFPTTSVRRHRLLLMLSLTALFSFTLPLSAQLRDVSIHVVINDLGNARVEEVRDAIIDDRATEGYLCMYNLQGGDVGELAVSDENGKVFTPVQPWNTSLSREEKAYKCGINEASDGKELCWGVGTPGRHIHRIRYTLTRLVKSYEDYDGFLFTFYQAARPYARHMKVTVSKEHGSFSPDDTRVWAFNYYGTIHIRDGKVVAETTSPFTEAGERMNLMVEFNKGLFHPATQVSTTFYKSVKKKAFKDSDYTDLEKEKGSGKVSLSGDGYEKESSWDELLELIRDTFIVILIFCYLFSILYIWASLSDFKEDIRQKKRLFGNAGGKIQEWYRHVPFADDLQKTANVLCCVDKKLCSRDALRKAYILRMLYNNRLRIVTTRDKKDNLAEMFLVEKPADKEQEGDYNNNYPLLLQTFLYDAAGDDHTLQPQEVEAYARKQPVELRKLARKMTNNLRLTGGKMSQLSKSDVTQVFGFQKFLKEFTLSDERNIKETGLWKEYLVHASLFGIAQQVGRDMKRIFPDIAQLGDIESNLAAIENLATVTDSSLHFIETYETPEERRKREQYERARSYSSSSSYSRSSGSGGSSSHSGGGGSRGGGGSGYR